MIGKLYSALASRAFSVFLLISIVLWVGFLGAWAVLSPPHVVQAIAGLAPFWALGGALVINIFFCMLKIISLVRRRPSTWGTIIFHLSMLAVLAGLLVSINTRFEGKAVVAEGQTFLGTKNEYIPRLSEEMEKRAPDVSFGVMSVQPEFFGNMLLFTSLKAHIGYPERTFEHAAWIKINKPLFIGLTAVRLTGYGFTPLFIMKDSTGAEVDGGFVNLKVFPPGQEDFIIPQFLPLKIFVRVFPDAEIKEGNIVNYSNNLREPVIAARVVRGKLVLFDGPLKLGEPAKFEGYQLIFPELRKWGEIQIVRDPGLPVVLAGFIGIILGLLIKFAR